MVRKALIPKRIINEETSWVIVFNRKKGIKYRDTKMWRNSLDMCRYPFSSKREAQDILDSLNCNLDEYYVSTIFNQKLKEISAERW